MMYIVHEVLLNFSRKPLQKLICNGHTHLELLLVEYEEGRGGLEEFEEVEYRELLRHGFESFGAICWKRFNCVN